MANFDTNYWSGASYTPTDYGMPSAAPDWTPNFTTIGASSPNYQQPSYYDQYAGYQPNFGPAANVDYWGGAMPAAPEAASGSTGILGSIKDWLGQSSGPSADGRPSSTNGSNLLTAGIGAGLGLLQAAALNRANKKQQAADAARRANAGKDAAKQRADYLAALRQDPNFRNFTVDAPDRTQTANPTQGAAYGSNGGGEHLYFDPTFLSKVKLNPVPLASGGMPLQHLASFLMKGQQLPDSQNPQDYNKGGLNRLVKGNGGGQDDTIHAKLSPAEYVMDADTVSALGDGSPVEGAKKLDKMRVNIRKHKRSGGLSSIPPKAKKPEGYL